MRRIDLIIAADLLLLLVVAQLALPGIAEQRLRDRLARSGKVLDVEVDAFPAIELLWHHADHVVVRMATYRSSASALGPTIGQAGDVGTLDASTRRLDAGLLTLRDAELHKRGSVLTGTARVSEADLQAA